MEWKKASEGCSCREILENYTKNKTAINELLLEKFKFLPPPFPLPIGITVLIDNMVKVFDNEGKNCYIGRKKKKRPIIYREYLSDRI